MAVIVRIRQTSSPIFLKMLSRLRGKFIQFISTDFCYDLLHRFCNYVCSMWRSTNFQSIDRHSLSSTSSSKFKPQLVDPYVYHHEDSLPSPTREIQNKPFLDFSRPTTVTSSENESFCSVYGIDSFRMVHKHRMRHSCCSYLSEDFLPDMDSRSELSSTASSYFASHSPSSTLSISYSRVSKPIKRQKICHV